MFWSTARHFILIRSSAEGFEILASREIFVGLKLCYYEKEFCAETLYWAAVTYIRIKIVEK